MSLPGTKATGLAPLVCGLNIDRCGAYSGPSEADFTERSEDERGTDLGLQLAITSLVDP